MTDQPTIDDAYARIVRRKASAGMEQATVERLRDIPAVLAGTDLTVDECDEWTQKYGAALLPVAIARGPMAVIGSGFVEGILVGLELAAMRAQAEDLGGRLRDLRRRLLELAEATVEAHDAGDLINRDKGHDALTLGERVLEEIGRL